MARAESAGDRVVSVNQIIGYNLARLRKAGGMTQDLLGEYLWGMTGIAWSRASISAAERSWDGNRIRKFDGDELLALSMALQVPVEAFFLPPAESDAVGVRVSSGNEDLTWTMGEYASILFPRLGPWSDGSSGEYLRSLQDAFDRFAEGREPPERPALDKEGALRQRRQVLMARLIALGDMARETRADIDHINGVLPPEADEEPGETVEDEGVSS